jgi:hypothetical protein
MQRAVLRLRLGVTYGSFPALALAIGVAAATVGFAAASLTATRSVPVRADSSLVAGNAVLQYFRGWHPVAAPRIPGLALKNTAAVAPDAAGQRAGLVVGELPAAGGSPLPTSLLTRLRAPAQVAVVTFGSFDAYRYDGLRIEGFDRPITLYAIPGHDHPTAVACYAAAGAGADLQTCTRMVATLDLAGAATDPLTPSPGYAHAVTGAIGRLDTARRVERPGLRGEPSAGAAAASRLAAAYLAAARTVGVASAPNPVTTVDEQLQAALRSATAAYRALESATRAQDPTAYAAARTGVDRAERDANATLAELAAFGYGRTVSPPRG